MFKKTILYISPFTFSPSTTGGERAINAYIHELAKENIVIVSVPKEQKDIHSDNIELLRYYNVTKLKYINLLAYWKVYKYAKKRSVNTVYFAFPYQGYFSYVIAKLCHAELIYHSHNIEFLRFKRMKRIWWPLMYLYEIILYKLIDRVDSISQEDIKKIMYYFKISKSKLRYSPYKIDKSIFRQDAEGGKRARKALGLAKEPIVLFFGSLDYLPNKEAIDIIEKKIAPKVIEKNRELKFVIVGRNPPKISKKSIIYTGYVNSIEDYINASNIVIAPLLSGGGVKTKIIEALACHKPVITTHIGAEGIDLGLYKGCLILTDSIGNFPKLILKHISKS